MKILQLCKKFPWPLKDGEAIACTYLAQAYRDLGHEVHLLSMNTSKHFLDINTLPADFDHYTRLHTVYVDNRILPIPALLNLFTQQSYHIQRFDNQQFAAKLSEILFNETFDIIQIESIYLAPYLSIIRQHSQAKIVLRAHNVEHEIWERVAEQSNPLKAWYLRTITPRLKKYEIGCLNQFDFVAAISPRDLEQFQRLGLRQPGNVTPIGIACERYAPINIDGKTPLSLSFIGSLDWMPNQDGLRWFLDEVWQPLLAPEFPDLTFHIAGRTAPMWLRQINMERVHFHGEVASATDFLRQHTLMAVPLLSGGGMRAKILEGMALGQVVLSTQVGMEGIPALHQEECLLADEPAAWVEAIKFCYNHPNQLSQISRSARNFCVQHFDNVQVAQNLLTDLSH
jgi:polysaccharide biosynthesis protein PslH